MTTYLAVALLLTRRYCTFLLFFTVPISHAFSAVLKQESSTYWISQTAVDATPPSVLSKIQESPWRGALEPAIDVPYPLECKVIQGKIPKSLKGTLFRNGPGRIRVGESLYQHWFDGDGYVVKITIDGSSNQATLQAKYVQTERFKSEGDGQGGMTQRGAWTDAKNGSWFSNLFKKPTNPGNTSCRVVKDKDGKSILLAMAEGGPPHEMDIKTLDTVGYYDYNAPQEFGTPDSCASAHSVESDDEMYTCGLRLGVASAWPSLAQLKAFKFTTSEDGVLELDATATIDLPYISFVHDMCISESHVAFVIPPYQATGQDLLASVVSTPPLGKRFKWDPQSETRIVVLKRSDMSVVADVTTPEYLSTYHIINARDLTGNDFINIQLAAHNGPREDVERVFGNLYNEVFTDEQRCRLVNVVVTKDDSVQIQDVGPDNASHFELPTIHPNFVGKLHTQVFTNAAYPSDSELVNSVERLDLTTGKVDRASFGSHRFAMEPVVIPKAGDKNKELDAYVLTLVYDSQLHVTDCVILDAARLGAGPVATIRMPAHVPLGFHGTWVNDTF